MSVGAGAAGLGGLLAAGFAAMLLMGAAGTTASCGEPAGRVDPGGLPAEVAGFTGVQLTNAAAIMNAAADAGLGSDAQLLGVMTAIGESSLVCVDHGDTAGPDSRGCFQQRDNGAWGSYEDRMDPYTAAGSFYRVLVAVPGWQALPPSHAAHAVQRNANPDHYTTFLPAARELVTGLTGTRPGCPARDAGDDYPWPGNAVEADGGGLSPLGYYYRECVDFVAWRLNRDAGTPNPFSYTWANLTPLGGDANAWKRNWDAHGWATGHTPAAGAVAWWGTGRYGHVAYVHAVNPDGTVLLEEYNWGTPKHRYGTRTVAATDVDLFLYAPGDAR